MKKKNFTILIIFTVILSFCYAEGKQQKVVEKILIKTYFLKNISPKTAARALRPYILGESVLESKKMLTVTLFERNVKEFERLLKSLDKKMRKIYLRIFTVIARNDTSKDDISNEDLKSVIRELKKILGFKSYILDGKSFITLKEGTSRANLKISSNALQHSMNQSKISFSQITISGDTKGKRTIELRLLTRFGLDTEIAIAEGGYVVAGVSHIKYGATNASIILILNAKISE
jgi:type II secretory pathway component GspD/PulD (secretin)